MNNFQLKQIRHIFMSYIYSLPVSDKSGQRSLLDQDFEILSWIEILQEVNSNLNKVSTKFLRLTHQKQHLINCFRHYGRTYLSGTPSNSTWNLKIRGSQLQKHQLRHGKFYKIIMLNLIIQFIHNRIHIRNQIAQFGSWTRGNWI